MRTTELITCALVLATLLGGCYAYAPLARPVPAPASQLRLRLSTPEDVRLADVTMHDVAEVEGELVTVQDSALVVSATRLASSSGFERLGGGATVRLSRAAIASMEVKRLSRLRTALFAGGLVALAVAADAAFGGGVLFGEGSGPPNSQQ